MNRSSAIITAVVLLLLFLFLFQVLLPGRFLFLFPYIAVIRDEAAAHGLDPALVAAVIRVESNFRPDAVSRRGARGLMQVMPSTAGYVLEKSGYHGVEDLEEGLLTPAFNIKLGCWYLAYLLDYYDSDIILSLAAYNAGPGNVDRWLREEIWDGTLANIQQIPYLETRNYVERVHYFWKRLSWLSQLI